MSIVEQVVKLSSGMGASDTPGSVGHPQNVGLEIDSAITIVIGVQDYIQAKAHPPLRMIIFQIARHHESFYSEFWLQTRSTKTPPHLANANSFPVPGLTVTYAARR